MPWTIPKEEQRNINTQPQVFRSAVLAQIFPITAKLSYNALRLISKERDNMKNRRNFMRHTKFILCCALFTFICVFGSAAAFAEGGDAALLDREGRPLTAENFAYYDAALEAFADSLEAGNRV